MGAIVGTAGWTLSRSDAARFPVEGSALERYAQLFNGVEVNSSFHRSHRASTWARWAESVPASFRFAVKIPKTITHRAKLVDVEELTDEFAQQVSALGDKLGLLLVQLPPKLAFDARLAERFFEHLGTSTGARLVCEPRHLSWFTHEANDMLSRSEVVRAAADPALTSCAAIPGGWHGLAYWRLHGAPHIYRSSYAAQAIAYYAGEVARTRDANIETWCIFDNTAASAATGNALALQSELVGSSDHVERADPAAD